MHCHVAPQYAHRIVWTASGEMFATASHDGFVKAFRLNFEEESLSATEAWSIPFPSTVEDVEPLQVVRC